VSSTGNVNTATVNETRDDTNSLTGVTHEFSETSGLVPEYVTAAIRVPRGYFEEVWRKENPVPADQPPLQPDRAALATIETRVIQEIENAVAALLPEPEPGEDQFPRIRVTPYTQTPPPVPPAPSITDTASSWFSANWETLGLFAMTVAGVLLLRGMVRSSDRAVGEAALPGELPIASFVRPPAEEGTQGDDGGEDPARTLKVRFQHSGRSLRDELTELVKEDPDAAANVLRNWIGDAA
jgi:flagellar M-ring protein FliF